MRIKVSISITFVTLGEEMSAASIAMYPFKRRDWHVRSFTDGELGTEISQKGHIQLQQNLEALGRVILN